VRARDLAARFDPGPQAAAGGDAAADGGGDPKASG